MGILSNIDKKMKIRWKLIIPITFITAIGVLITILVTGYSLHWITLYQAKKETFPLYFSSVKASLVKDMASPNYRELRDYYLSTLKNVKIFRSKKVDSQFGAERSGFYPDEEEMKLIEKTLSENREVSIYQIDNRLKGIYILKAKKICISCHKVKPGDVLGAMVVEIPLKKVFSAVKEIQTLFVLLGVMGILVTPLILYIAYAITHSPLDKLEEVIEKIAEGDLTVKVGFRDRVDIVGRIARSIEKLLASFIPLNEKSLLHSQNLAELTTQNLKEINKVLEKAKIQNSQAAQVANAIEELSATIANIAKNASDISQLAVQNIDATIEGKNISEEAVKVIIKANEDTKALKTVIEGLNQRTNEIGYIVQLIKDIADQTNLLALNATIEAARAGEHGKGFAVVAEEIRKLADRTLKATDDISEKVKNIQSESSKAFESMEVTAKEVEKAVENLDTLKNALDVIVFSSQEVKDLITQVASATEEQSTATKKISKNMEETLKLTNEVTQLIDELSKNIYTLVNASSDLRHAATLVKTKKLREILFDIFKSDYERLCLRVEGHIRGFDKLDPELLGNYKACGIGKWYYSEEGEKFRGYPVFIEFEKLHKKLHSMGKEIILAYNSGDIEKAEKLMAEAKSFTPQMMSLFEKMKEIYLKELESEE